MTLHCKEPSVHDHEGSVILKGLNDRLYRTHWNVCKRKTKLLNTRISSVYHRHRDGVQKVQDHNWCSNKWISKGMWEVRKESKDKICKYTAHILVKKSKKKKKCSQTEATEFKFSPSFQEQSFTVANCRHGKGKVNKAETGQKKWRENKRQERKWRHMENNKYLFGK